MVNCPCGSQRSYACCCGLYLEGNQAAPTPEALMRSRYTAYHLANVEYIKKTMSGKPLIGFDEIEAKRWAKKVCWIDLRIINTFSQQDDLGFVEFIARFIDGGTLKSLHETSEFHGEKGIWFYVDGIQQPIPPQRIQRNAPCPCGRQKKFKNCHAQK